MSRLAFRIRNRDGLFSKGGYSPRFTKKGKTWNSSGALNSHLAICGDNALKFYKEQGAEVVSFEVVETICDCQTLEERIAARDLRESERKAAEKRRYAEYQRQRDLREFERLRKVLEGE